MKKINWRYAIGELIIITIGISLAFALNRWAEQNQQEKTAAFYMENLKDDLHHDVLLLDSNIQEMTRRRNYLSSLFPHFYTEIPGRDSLAMQVFQYVDPVVFRLRESTWQSMKSSGEIKLVQDLKLKAAILEHYAEYSKIDDELERHTTFARNFLAPYFMREINYSKLKQENYPFLGDSYFQNLMHALDGVYRLEIEAHKIAKDSAEKLLLQLEA